MRAQWQILMTCCRLIVKSFSAFTEFDISRKSVVSYIRFQYDESDSMANLEPNIQTIDIEPKDKSIIVSDGYTITP
jgi:hypothetical protein